MLVGCRPELGGLGLDARLDLADRLSLALLELDDLAADLVERAIEVVPERAQALLDLGLREGQPFGEVIGDLSFLLEQRGAPLRRESALVVRDRRCGLGPLSRERAPNLLQVRLRRLLDGRSELGPPGLDRRLVDHGAPARLPERERQCHDGDHRHSQQTGEKPYSHELNLPLFR